MMWLEVFSDTYAKKNLDWTLETATKHAWDTKGQRETITQ
jgi:hypothetical protein